MVRFRQDGINQSATFRTKAECQVWVTNLEIDLSNKKLGKIPDKTFADLLGKYLDEVADTKDGGHWERIRIKKILGQGKEPEPDPITKINLQDFGVDHCAQWRRL